MARTVVKIVGMASRNKGVSNRTGKAYDMQEAVMTFPNPWDAGKQSVAIATFDGSICDELQVHVGGEYIASVNVTRSGTFVDLISEAT